MSKKKTPSKNSKVFGDRVIAKATEPTNSPSEAPITRAVQKEEPVSRAPRTNPAAKAAYRNTDSLEFSPELVEAFNLRGYKLHWANVVDYQSRTATNHRINHFLAVGGHVVTPQEVKKIDPNFLSGLTRYEYREEFADEDDRSKGNAVGIKKNGLVLVAVPLDYVEARRQNNEELVHEQLQTKVKDYQNKEDARVNKFDHRSGLANIQKGFFS